MTAPNDTPDVLDPVTAGNYRALLDIQGALADDGHHGLAATLAVIPGYLRQRDAVFQVLRDIDGPDGMRDCACLGCVALRGLLVMARQAALLVPSRRKR